jgi:AcrR family transcriptional regulator
MVNPEKKNKAEETAAGIRAAALELFRSDGFEAATMRGIAVKAGVATGAAYYYYESKDAIVMDFYRRASEQMQPEIEAALRNERGLATLLRRLIGVKLDHFAENRSVLRALLRVGADPKNPLSPFSEQTREIRDTDTAWFERVLAQSAVKVHRGLASRLPRVLWFLQMGIILFWVIDETEERRRTTRLLELSTSIAVTLIRLSSLPLMRPVRRTAVELIDLITGESA